MHSAVIGMNTVYTFLSSCHHVVYLRCVDLSSKAHVCVSWGLGLMLTLIVLFPGFHQCHFHYRSEDGQFKMTFISFANGSLS